MPWQKEAQQLMAKQMEDFFFGGTEALPPEYKPNRFRFQVPVPVPFRSESSDFGQHGFSNAKPEPGTWNPVRGVY